MIIITSKIFKNDRWEQLHRKYLKRSVGKPRSKVFKGIVGNNYIKIFKETATKLSSLNI